MKPLLLVMQAFVSYGEKTSIDFGKPNQNLFLITGDTGAGKTTIFDAIVFALYGESSSNSNKKDGIELQSQYVENDTVPFVELTFSETRGGEEQIYRVKRQPRYLRKKKTKRGEGDFKEETESVELELPDGSIYPGKKKETDSKIEEIIGLSKSQFMQVAMIAQGEFMTLLRADSNEKKVIFRKLFGTEVFSKIVDELLCRRNEKKDVIERLNLQCQTYIGSVIIPSNLDTMLETEILKRKITSSSKVDIVEVEEMEKRLESLCKNLKEEKNLKSSIYEEKKIIRDKRRDEYTLALTLTKAFEEFENAQRSLEECRLREKEVEELRELSSKIQAAYFLNSFYQRYEDSIKAKEKVSEQLAVNTDILPEVTEKKEECAKILEVKKADRNKALEEFTKISEKVTRALNIFSQIKAAEEKIQESGKSISLFEEKVVADKENLKKLSSSLEEDNNKLDTLAGSQEKLTLLQEKKKSWEEIRNDAAKNSVLSNELEKLKKSVEKSERDYIKARDSYNDEQSEYIKIQNAYFDAQAGILARDKLKDNEPCPVCGSLSHPHPCVIEVDLSAVTRESVDKKALEVRKRQEELEKASQKSSSDRAGFRAKSEQFSDEENKLKNKLKKSIEVIPDDITLDQMTDIIEQTINEFDDNISKAKSLVKEYNMLKDHVKKTQEDIEKLTGEVKHEDEQLSEMKIEEAKQKSNLEALSLQKEFEDEESANTVLKIAEDANRKADRALKDAEEKEKLSKKKFDEVNAVIARCKEELPEREKEKNLRKKAYEDAEKEKNVSQNIWKELIVKYKDSDVTAFNEQIDEFNKKKSEALGAQNTAKKAIEGKEKPDLEKLNIEKLEAENELAKAQNELSSISDALRTDANCLTQLSDKLSEREKIAGDYTRIDSLYNRLSGKLTGSRMDFETFVQRKYLERILYAANKRFEEMSAGQFELRMVDTDKAGSGKNRGLDLMVYSLVTGKEREVRTLSGGESFMAALSLALGMADQITASTSAICLDMMFVDEGFGSLDDHSRNQAVRVLQNMAGSSKLIGIISHVTELKEEIENQLIVTKKDNGSHAHWEIS